MDRSLINSPPSESNTNSGSQNSTGNKRKLGDSGFEINEDKETKKQKLDTVRDKFMDFRQDVFKHLPITEICNLFDAVTDQHRHIINNLMIHQFYKSCNAIKSGDCIVYIDPYRMVSMNSRESRMYQELNSMSGEIKYLDIGNEYSSLSVFLFVLSSINHRAFLFNCAAHIKPRCILYEIFSLIHKYESDIVFNSCWKDLQDNITLNIDKRISSNITQYIESIDFYEEFFRSTKMYEWKVHSNILETYLFYCPDRAYELPEEYKTFEVMDEEWKMVNMYLWKMGDVEEMKRISTFRIEAQRKKIEEKKKEEEKKEDEKRAEEEKKKKEEEEKKMATSRESLGPRPEGGTISGGVFRPQPPFLAFGQTGSNPGPNFKQPCVPLAPPKK